MPLLGFESVSRTDPAYKACVVGITLAGVPIGTTMGSLALPGIGTVAGYLAGPAIGFAFGYLACPYVAPGLKRKLELGTILTDAEVRDAAEAMSQYASVASARDVLRLVALARHMAPAPRTVPVCRSPAATARQLLAA